VFSYTLSYDVPPQLKTRTLGGISEVGDNTHTRPMPTESDVDRSRIYCEGGEWLRTINAIQWSVGAVFVPTALFVLGYAVTHAAAPVVPSALGSLAAFSMWLFASYIYRETGATTRDVLMRLEREAGIPEELALYCRQGQIGQRRFSFWRIQMASLLILAGAWIALGAGCIPRMSQP
jgi:hypothetical protein